MKTVLKPVFVAIMLLFVASVSAQRSGTPKDPTLNKGEGLEKTRSDLEKMRNQKQDKNSRQEDVFMFAASFSLLDSVLYVSQVREVDNVTINNKWFVKDRAVFEKQFTDHVSKWSYGESMLTSIFFSEKLKKMERRRERLIKRNAKKNGFELKKVSDFMFVNPTEN